MTPGTRVRRKPRPNGAAGLLKFGVTKMSKKKYGNYVSQGFVFAFGGLIAMKPSTTHMPHARA